MNENKEKTVESILNIPIVDRLEEPAQEEQVKRSRGNPNFVKKVKRAEIVEETGITDPWEVRGKDPELHYVWGRKSSDVEMNMFAAKGYIPARGNEKIMTNPFEAVKCEEGKTKERGDRILMCCPNSMVEARRAEQLGRRVSVKQAARAEARQMSSSGVSVRAEVDEETKRESLNENI